MESILNNEVQNCYEISFELIKDSQWTLPIYLTILGCLSLFQQVYLPQNWFLLIILSILHRYLFNSNNHVINSIVAFIYFPNTTFADELKDTLYYPDYNLFSYIGDSLSEKQLIIYHISGHLIIKKSAILKCEFVLSIIVSRYTQTNIFKSQGWVRKVSNIWEFKYANVAKFKYSTMPVFK